MILLFLTKKPHQIDTFITNPIFKCLRRYCFVQLRPNADVEQVKEALSRIPFGAGTITAELKNTPHREAVDVGPQDIDPFTLYVGNLPTNVTVRRVEEVFHQASRVDIGFAQRMRHTRYAFIKYRTVDEAIEAFRDAVHITLGGRSLVIRFRRLHGTIGMADGADGEPTGDGTRLDGTKAAEVVGSAEAVEPAPATPAESLLVDAAATETKTIDNGQLTTNSEQMPSSVMDDSSTREQTVASGDGAEDSREETKNSGAGVGVVIKTEIYHDDDGDEEDDFDYFDGNCLKRISVPYCDNRNLFGYALQA